MKPSSSISVRILLVVLVTVVSVLAVSSVIELKILERREDAALQTRGALTADRIANTLAYPVWSLNQAETERVVIHELSAGDVVRIHVLNEDGKLYVGKVKDKTGKLLDVNDNSVANSAGLYNFTRELVFKDTRLGSVRLDVTDDHARTELEKLGWGIAIKLLLVAVLLSVVLFLALRSLVIRPLSSLRSWIKSPSGISAPVPHFKGSMEINSLADAFREMGAILRSKNEELEAERERLERVVTESDDLYNNAPCGYHSLDKDRVYVQINDTELKWLGLTREEVVGKLRFDDVLTHEGRRLLEVKYPEFIAQGFMRDVEYELLCKDGTTKAILLSASAAYDSKGDYLMSRSTLYDIDERKEAEQALRRSEEKFAKAFLSSPVGLAITRLSDGVYLDANEALARAVGYSREELLGRSTLELGIWPDPNERQRFVSSLETEKFVREVELKFQSRNGKLITALLSGEVIEIAGEQCVLSVLQDITERRYMEELLKANETLLRVFIKHAPASIAMFDNNMRYLQVSDRFLSDYGLEGQDLTGRGHYEVFPDLPDKWRQVHSRVLKGAHEKCQEESYSFDGVSTEWVQWEALPWRKPGGEIGGLILMTRLITERKRAELALRASEERFSKIFDLSPFRMGIVRISDGVVLDVNAAWSRETGFSREEIVGHKMDELGQWLTDETRRRSLEVLREGKSVNDFEGEIFTKSGEKRWVLASAQRIEFDEPCLLWAANDITDRKRAEHLLQASERRFAVAFNSNPVMTSISTLEGGQFMAVSESFVEITGHSRDEAIGNTALGLGLWTDPTERSDMMERLHNEGRVRNVEMQMRVKNGDKLVLLLSAERIEVDGRPCLLHAGIDITERRRAQDENRKLLHNLGERIKELTALQNASRILQDNELELPEVFREIASLIPLAFQYSELAAVRISLGDLLIESPNFSPDYPILRTDCETRDGQKGSIEVVYSQECPPEAEGPYLLEERALLDTLADMLKATCERRQAEEELQRSEERYRALFETAPNAISVFDSSLRLLMTNQRAAKLYGFRQADDLLGIDIFRFVAPEDRPRIKDLLTRIKTTGNLELFECLGVRKDGTHFLMETLATLLPNPEGLAPSILTVNTDITERKEAEKALKVSEEQLRALSAKMRSAREEEGTRIAREIHDELGGALTGIKWDLEGIDSRLASANGKIVLPEVRKRITSMTGLIESTINTVRRISSELRPGVLDDLGLVAAIEWQGQQFEERTGLKVHFETQEDIAEVNREGATAVFRIFQEVLTNVLRHSQAQNIHVKLLDLDHEIELEVSDDGRGITEREKRNTRSLGLLGMKERALLVGGHVNIRGSKGRGTTVTVRVPKNYEPM